MIVVTRRLSRRRRSARVPVVLVLMVLAVLTASSGCTLPGRSGSGEAVSPSPIGSPTPPPTGPGAAPSGTATTAAVGSPGQPGDPARDPAADPAFAAFYGQKVTWADCKDGFQCASVTVPIDWAAPSGATLKLAAIRQRAKGTKLGSLLLNPGGPGAPGLGYLRDAAAGYAALRTHYDLVSWDTRGVGASDPVSCLPNSALDRFFSIDWTPDTAAERTAFVDENTAFAAACEAHTGELLQHVDTLSTVKDMDVLRGVLGDQLLSYMGASYGTFLGAWYAQEFPWRVGRLVLDGAVDPSLTSAQFAQGQALGFSRAVSAYVDNCLRTKGCPLKGTRADAYAQLTRLLAKVDAQPLTTEQGRPLTQALLNTGVLQGMYTEQLWPAVTTALTEAFRGDGSTMLLLADLYLERDEKGVYGQTLQALNPIFCLDIPEPRTVDQIAVDAARLQTMYPPFGDVLGWGSVGCAVWPLKGTTPPQKVKAPGARPILVVGTTQDPATPYEWAQGLAAQLSSGHLLTRKGQGHTGYGMGSKCTDRAVEKYLLAGVVPADGATCS